MRDNEGNKLMPLWKYKDSFSCYIVAAWTRKEAINLLQANGNYSWPDYIVDIVNQDIKRIKNCFASFKEGKILT